MLRAVHVMLPQMTTFVRLKWINGMLAEFGAAQTEPSLLFADSANALTTVLNPLNSARTRSIDSVQMDPASSSTQEGGSASSAGPRNGVRRPHEATGSREAHQVRETAWIRHFYHQKWLVFGGTAGRTGLLGKRGWQHHDGGILTWLDVAGRPWTSSPSRMSGLRDLRRRRQRYVVQ